MQQGKMKILHVLLVVLFVWSVVTVDGMKDKSRTRRRSTRRRPHDRRPLRITTPEPPTTTKQQQEEKPKMERQHHKPQFTMNGPVPDAPLAIHRTTADGEGPSANRQRGLGRDRTLGVRNRLSIEQKLILLGAHNDFRGQVRPQAANMVALQWDDELADLAQSWADGCQFMHGGTDGSSRYGWVGQNLWVGSGTDWELYGMVESWYDEEQYYTYSNNYCNGVCGHYTQVVWAETQFVGCALRTCQSIPGLNGWSPASLLVCNYGEGGNYNGMKPYISGTPCSQCPTGYTSCIDGELCGLPDQVPENGGSDGTDESGPSQGGGAPDQPVEGGGGAPDSNPVGPPGPNGGSSDGNTVDGGPTCGGTLVANSGDITSPNWPAPYGINTHCRWIIRGKSDQTVTLDVAYMDIEAERQCSWDYLQIKPNGASGSSSTKFCGNVNPPAVTSQGNEMVLIFHSDGSVNKGGFMASYQLNGGKEETEAGPACGGTITGKKGNIKSPNYPQEYDNDLDCLWVIEVANTKRVRLFFRPNFGIEDQAACDFDRLTVRIGNERQPMVFCGNEVPNGNIISFGNRMEIRLVTDRAGAGSGFSAAWKAI